MTKIYSMKNKHPERQPQKAISSGCSFQRYFSSSLLLVIHKRLVLTPASCHCPCRRQRIRKVFYMGSISLAAGRKPFIFSRRLFGGERVHSERVPPPCCLPFVTRCRPDNPRQTAPSAQSPWEAGTR